ncbi:hypothetical protein [Leptolyngbya sp. FACHB-261]|uniref:hypothetical protein n=1 Tax=Leptolyngbya sp. FACHB-261 TaxID=2692806 RepID=UPI00168636BB|nr:hypothetical protein [Leptolyngbya sp. FACHB-261]MBD2104294.1 hypothetical protein [Leptolyngbya sp. FACHB-261]
MNMVFPFVPATNTAAAVWIEDRLQSFAESVLSIVPAKFSAYARVYHPAWQTINGQRTVIRWSDVATATNSVIHRQMQWPNIVDGYNPTHPPALNGSFEEPSTGSLPPKVSRPLWQALAPHTTTPEYCWFAVWEGHGCLNALVPSSPSFAIPHRRFHLFHASIEAIEASFSDSSFHQSANLWWPSDCAWCVATEIDFMTTYVAGTDAAIAALIACTELEVDKVEPTDGVTWASDTLNPPPSQSYT